MSVPDPAATDWVPIYAGAPAFEYLGDYVPATQYQDGDIVMYNGTPWLAVKATSTPPDPFPLAGGAQLTYEGDHVAATEYQDGDVVVKDNIAFLCVGGPTTVAPDAAPWGAAAMLPSPPVPTGGLMSFAGATAPTGWLMCDGASLLRADYAALFAVIGTAYGSADGSHFNLPDMQGRIPVGKGTHTDVNTLNKNEGAAVASRSVKHRHTVTDAGHFHTFTYGAGNSVGGSQQNWGGSFDNTTVGKNTDTKGTGITVGPAGTTLDTPSFIVVNYIIKT